MQTLYLLTPEIVLIATAVSIYIAGAFVETRKVWGWIALVGIVVAGVCLWRLGGSEVTEGPLVLDALGLYVRSLVLLAGGLFALMALRPLDGPGTPEYIGSLLLAVAGVMLAAGSRELVLIFVGLELVSIPTYILLFLGRRDSGSEESTVKYFYLSILASAMLLYGLSFLYGIAGSTDLNVIQERLTAGIAASAGTLDLSKLALVLIFAGLGFKIAAVPFHFYAPDVYQGTTHQNAGLLSVLPKVAGFVVLIRIVAIGMEGLGEPPWRIAMALAVLTMTVGNVTALWQENLRRLLAYSSIAHAGYMLIALAAYLASDGSSQWNGIGALLLYLSVYVVATIGTFAALSCLGRDGRQIDGIEELAGLGWTEGTLRPMLAWSLGVFMFSLAGIPPLAGFWGKFAVFASALSVDSSGDSVRIWFIGLAVVGALNAAIAAAYYLRVISVMFFRMPLGTPEVRKSTAGAFAVTVFCGILVLVIGLTPGTWIQDATTASPKKLTTSGGGKPGDASLAVCIDAERATRSNRSEALPNITQEISDRFAFSETVPLGADKRKWVAIPVCPSLGGDPDSTLYEK